ncbi:hypothetical protein Tco_0997547 [Tanacetum coccineum]
MRDIVRLKTERELVRVKIHDGNAFWNEIGVNAGVSKLMLLSLNLLLPVLVNAAKLKLTAASINKPEESKGFEQIINFLNASSIRYALTVNPTIYTSCIKQFWATAKAKTVNEEVQIQALVDGKKNLEGGVKFLMYPRFVQVFLDKQVEDMSKHKEIYVTPSYTKKIFANMKREGKRISSRITPLFQTIMVQAPEEVGERKQRKDSGPTEPITDEATNEEHVSTPSYDPSQSGEDRMQLNELMDLCAKLSDRVLALENTNTSQATEIATLKESVKKLEKKRRSKTYKPRRLYKVGLSRRIESSDDASLGAQMIHPNREEIADLDADVEVTLIDETQRRNDKDLMFDSVCAADPITIAGEVVTTASVEIPEELTLAQTLIEIKSVKPKAATTAATTAKDKGKAKMVEPEKPLKKKDQIAIDEEVARNLEAQLQAELEEEERLSRQKKKKPT